MPYGSTMRKMIGGSPTSSVDRKPSFSYSPLGTAVWRHQRTDGAPTGSANALTTNNYFAVQQLRTAMTFSAVADTPPTPTFSNNYSSAACFNGSRMEDYQCVIRLKNNDAVVRYLDMYEVTLSYLEGHNWQTIMGAGQVPVTQEVSLADVDAGTTSITPPGAGVIDANNYANSITHQKFMRKVGTLEFGAAGSGDNTIILSYDSIPPKCRRANYGMLWALFFHNDFNKNGTATVNFSFNREFSFNEIPSENRIPFQQ